MIEAISQCGNHSNISVQIIRSNSFKNEINDKLGSNKCLMINCDYYIAIFETI